MRAIPSRITGEQTMAAVLGPMAFERDAAGAVGGDERLGLAVLNASGCVNRMTAAAFAMAREGLFSIEQGPLRFAQATAASWLGARVASLQDTVHASSSSQLIWDSPEHRIELGWWPLRWLERLGADPEGLLAIRQSRRNARASSPAEACHGLGLTSTETEIVLRLVKGELVKQIAAARGTSVMTVRSQLRTIFQKTGTAKQLHLVQRVMQLAADGANGIRDNANLFMVRPPTANVEHGMWKVERGRERLAPGLGARLAPEHA